MKIFLLFTALSLLYPISAYTTARSRNIGLSLLIRGASIPEEPQHVPEIGPGDHPDVVQPETDIGRTTAPKTKLEKLMNLPLPKWWVYNPTRIAMVSDMRGISLWEFFKNTYLPRTKFQGDPTKLFEMDASGNPIAKDETPVDLTLKKPKLRQFQRTLADGNKVLYVYNGKLDKGARVTLNNVFLYKPTYYTTQEGIEKFATAQGLFKSTYLTKFSIQRRSNIIETLSNVQSNPATIESTQDGAAIFEQYLGVYTKLQASIAALISPVLYNATSQTNLTIIHQMAQSIYYDLTGSTTSLNGPFNYGMTFLGNISNMTTGFLAGQGVNDTTFTPGNISDITEIYTTLEDIYTAMWVQALTAANSTGLYAQQVYIAGCLCTNDTSVYPAGFTTVDKSARADF